MLRSSLIFNPVHILLWFVCFCASFQRASGEEAAKIFVLSDVAYKTGDALTEYERERCKLDLYLPAEARDLPCLVWFHGGALKEGDKAHQNTVAVCRALAGEGMLVAAVSYRLSPKARYPAYIDDAAAAVAWVHQHAARHGGNPRRVFVAGHSAGGYLAALVALDGSYLQKYGLTPASLAGVMPIAGQMVTHYTVREERGLPKTKIIVDDAAPLHHTRADTPPLLLLYAEKDLPLRAEENRYFAAALANAGNRNVTVREISGHDHGGIGDRIAEEESPVRAALTRFVQETTGKAGAEAGWRSLFNGRDLEGWSQVGTAKWRVEDGTIVGGQDGDPKRSGLLTTSGQFRDFELKLEFMIDEHGKYNSGVYLRNDSGTAERTGYQVNIGRGAAEEFCAGLFTDRWLAKGDENDSIRKKLDWNQLHIIARGGHVQVTLNGLKVVDFTDPDPPMKFLQEGVVGFQTYGAEGHAGWVKFRRIFIRELAETTAIPES
jgi:acetyl esterase/lipase